MQLFIIWENKKTELMKQYSSEIVELHNLQENIEIINLELNNIKNYSVLENIDINSTPSIILVEPDLDFSEVLIDWQNISKPQLKDLIETLFWLNQSSSSCSTSWCGSCSWCQS